MTVDRTIFDEPHYELLELLAAVALADGNIAPAFKLADPTTPHSPRTGGPLLCPARGGILSNGCQS